MRRWVLGIALGLSCAGALWAEDEIADTGKRWAVSLTPYYNKFPGGELALERRYARASSLRLLLDYRPESYLGIAKREEIGGGLAQRWYWFSSMPMSGLFLDLKALAFHADDVDSWNLPYQYSRFGGGLDLGWQWAVRETDWRISLVGDLIWLVSDKAHTSFGFRAPPLADDPNGRLHLNFWLGVARLF